MRLDWRHRIAAAVLLLQLLLLSGTYHSTDFEVHRNWLAITYSLPISQWYYEATSEWTLDYPPLFAWFEAGLARAAALVDPAMLAVANLNHASDATELFQRLSVIGSGLVLTAAALRAARRFPAGDARGAAAVFVLAASAGLIIVDNIHFQYNGLLLGLLLFSVLLLEDGAALAGGLVFAVLLNMKHLFAYVGPVYFVYLLRHYVLAPVWDQPGPPAGAWAAAAGRLLRLGGGVLAVCGASLGPFVVMGQLGQVLSRLFPFARGLCHAYWAPNAWALYSFADKAAAAVAARAGLLERGVANMAGGLVGTSHFLVLPNVGAGAAAALVVASLLPCLVALWRARDGAAAARLLAPAVAYANLCGFMWGYHVHEKAALTVLVPMGLAALRDGAWGTRYALLSAAGHVGLFPLLFEPREVPLRWALALLYHVGTVWALATVHLQRWRAGGGGGEDAKEVAAPAAAGEPPAKEPAAVAGEPSPAAAAQSSPGTAGKPARRKPGRAEAQAQAAPAAAAAAGAGALPPSSAAAACAPSGMAECCAWLPAHYRAYLAGLVLLELYCTFGHWPLLGDRLPFLPLMLTSVYCGAAFACVWAWMAAWFLVRCGG